MTCSIIIEVHIIIVIYQLDPVFRLRHCGCCLAGLSCLRIRPSSGTGGKYTKFYITVVMQMKVITEI